jgi:hypothetical protein
VLCMQLHVHDFFLGNVEVFWSRDILNLYSCSICFITYRESVDVLKSVLMLRLIRTL